MSLAISVAVAIAASSLASQGISPSAPVMELRVGPSNVFQVRIQTEAELRRVLESDAGGIVRDVISRFPDLGRVGTLRQVNVVAEQLPADWLPHVKGVTFQRRSLNSDSWHSNCVRLLWLSASSDGAMLKVTVQEGNRCDGTGLIAIYTREGQRWKAHPTLDSRTATGSPHCDCN